MKRTTYNLGAPNNTTLRIGDLVPIQVLEILPNDTIKASSNILARMAPMLAPIFTRIDLRVHHFYMSQKNIWEHWNEWEAEFNSDNDDMFDWKSFITGNTKKYGRDDMPAIAIGGLGNPPTGNELADKFGLPANFLATGQTMQVNAGPYVMYNHIWNEFYRDEQLNTRRSPIDTSVAPISYAKDYFTTARPFPTDDNQHTTVPITGNGGIPQIGPSQGQMRTLIAGTGNTNINLSSATGGGTMEWIDANVDMDIAEFRRALALNRWADLQNKYGDRYVEYMKYYLHSQMPYDDENAIYLGGGSSVINISEVLQTAPETDQTSDSEYGVGDMFGHGIAAMRGNEFQATFDEHGYLMTLVSIRPRANYQTTTDRFWLKSDRLDYYDPNLNDIGMQEVWENEIFPQAGSTFPLTDPGTWGWQDRYAEYRSRTGKIGGLFRNTLNYWSMSRDFTATPDLNAEFLEIDNDDTNRVFSSSDTDTVYLNINNRVKAKRIVKPASLGRTL